MASTLKLSSVAQAYPLHLPDVSRWSGRARSSATANAATDGGTQRHGPRARHVADEGARMFSDVL